jgi:hypothetical protein
MVELQDGLYLYHGSYTPVESIDLKRCVPYKDFGRGFYITSSLEQAKKFIRLSLNRAKMRGLVSEDTNRGYVSVYKLKLSCNLQIKYFSEANREWLHFVISNRDNDYFAELKTSYKKYNVVVGKIANDRTAATLQAYVENAYGEVGTVEADARAIETLLPNKLEDQICFRTEEAITSLQFVRSDCYEQ